MEQKQISKVKGDSQSPWTAATWGVCYLGFVGALILLPGPPLLDRLRWLDSGICAQMPTHTFYPGGESLPLCARNTGIYLGFIVTLITLYSSKRGRAQQLPPWPITAFLASGIVLLAIDGSNSLFLDIGLPHLYTPHNLLRLATGLVTGLALAALGLPVFNELFWREQNQQRSIPSWGGLLILLLPLSLCFLTVASLSLYFLYPLALLSTAGILTALSSLNLLFIIAISRRNGTFERYYQLLPFFSLALLLAIGEMLALAQLKQALMQALGM